MIIFYIIGKVWKHLNMPFCWRSFKKRKKIQMAVVQTANKAPNQLLNQSVMDPQEKEGHFFTFSAL